MIGYQRYLVSVEILNKENENFEKKLCCVNGINFITRWGGREDASMGGEREGADPLPAAGFGLSLRAPSRSGPRLPSRPPQPHSSPQVRPLPAPAAALPGAPPPPTVRGSTARARRLRGAGGGAPFPPPVPLLGPEKGGWVVARAKFPAPDSCEITTAHQRLCFAVSPPFSCSLTLPSPFPHSSLL